MGESPIADLLQQSQLQHQRARTARRHARVDDHFAAIREAQSLRLDAHGLDPTHLDQAWIAEQAQGFFHDALLIFYASELQKDQAQERIVAKSRLKKGLEEVRATARLVQ